MKNTTTTTNTTPTRGNDAATDAFANVSNFAARFYCAYWAAESSARCDLVNHANATSNAERQHYWRLYNEHATAARYLYDIAPAAADIILEEIMREERGGAGTRNYKRIAAALLALN